MPPPPTTALFPYTTLFRSTHWRLYLNGNLESEIVLSTGHLPQSSSIQHGSLASALNSSGTAAGFFDRKSTRLNCCNQIRSDQAFSLKIKIQIASYPGPIGP